MTLDVFVELFAVVTQMQRKKLGSKLMRALFEECDKQGKDIFLVTSTERNFDMYKHFGFEAIKRDYVEGFHALTYLLVRRHHCRVCGKIFCNKLSEEMKKRIFCFYFVIFNKLRAFYKK